MPRRLPPRALKLFWDTHSVLGVTLGIGLFVIFYAGAFSLPRADLMAWSDPALRVTASPPGTDEAVMPLMDARPPEAGSDVLVVHPFDGRRFYRVRYPTAASEVVDQWVSATTGQLLPVEGRSKVSEIPFRLHYFAQAGLGGRILSGILGVVLLYTIVSGLLIHLRKLPRDWHTFRPRSGLRTALTDAHAVLGLVGIPFTVMYAVTGAFLSLLIVVLGPIVFAVFEGDEAGLDAVLNGVAIPEHVTGEASASMLSPEELRRSLPVVWEGAEIFRLDYHGWGRQGAFAVIDGGFADRLASGGRAVLDASTGELIDHRPPDDPTALAVAASALTTLHYGNFGGRWVDALYFILALAASAVILTGNVLWLVIRRKPAAEATPPVHRFLARATVGVCVGLVAAIPLLMVATHAIPLEVPGRQLWEDRIFFGGWLVLTGLGFIGSHPLLATRRLLWLAGALSLAAPVANGLATGAWLWRTPAMDQWAVFYIDLGMALSGLALLAIAARLPASTPPLPSRPAGAAPKRATGSRAAPTLEPGTRSS